MQVSSPSPPYLGSHPQRVQGQAHRSNTAGSPSVLGEEEEEGEAMPLCRMPSPSRKASGWHAACRADGLTAASPRSAAVYIWHTCFGSCRLALQMAGRGGWFAFYFLSPDLGGGRADHSHFTQGEANPAMSQSTWLSPARLRDGTWEADGQLPAPESCLLLGETCRGHCARPSVSEPPGMRISLPLSVSEMLPSP